MPTEVVMPQMGESIFEGTITKWLKKAGDTVQKDEPLFEISTDKVDAEIPSPVAGVLSEIKVREGETVQINTVVAVVSESGTSAQAAAPSPAASAPSKSGSKASAPSTSAKAAPAPSAAAPQAPAAAPAPSSASSGGTEVVMPQMGESIFEGTITKWLKKAGDTVQKDEPLFEISTDKVDAEIPSPVAGVLTEIKVSQGETVQINTVVAVIGGAVGAAQPDGTPAATAPAPAPDTADAKAAPPPAPADGSERIRSSPLVRRMARENNLDLSRIPGSGSDGRITKDDVLWYMSAGASEKLAPPQVLPGSLQPMSRMRGIIAQRMLESKLSSPHAYTVYKVDMTRIVRLREREKSAYEKRNGVKLTYMPFVAAAAVEALGKFPVVNASLENNSIRYHQNVHLGIAVALEWGLIVPVIKEAEDLSFLGLARAIADLAERARGKRLKPDEASGSTFTLTNSGIFGGEFGTPIINQPESAILAIGGLHKEPVVLTDAEGNDTIAIRSMQLFCLGFDHRIIDGADSGKFMSEFKKILETWDKEIG